MFGGEIEGGIEGRAGGKRTGKRGNCGVERTKENLQGGRMAISKYICNRYIHWRGIDKDPDKGSDFSGGEHKKRFKQNGSYSAAHVLNTDGCMGSVGEIR